MAVSKTKQGILERKMLRTIRNCFQKTKGLRACSIEESDEYWTTMDELMQLELQRLGQTELPREPSD